MDGEHHSPLKGIVVLDLATECAELAGRILAELGADVIKIEPPGGVGSRFLPPWENEREGDPDGSLYWAAVGAGKRSVVLDLDHAADRARLCDLATGADVLIESFPPGKMKELGLGEGVLRDLNRGLIYVSVTAYGQDGPDAQAPATELTIEAAGGQVGLQGDGDRPPIPCGFPQAAFHAGAQAAADAIIALNEREQSGLGQYLDVSMQAAMVWTLLHATSYPALLGTDPPRAGEDRAAPPGELLPGVSMPMAWPCADGTVHGVLGGPVPAAAATLQSLLRWAEDEGKLDADLCGLTWTRWLVDLMEGCLSPAMVARAIKAVHAFCLTKTKSELMERARTENLFLAPVYTIEDVRNDPQLAARGYWVEIDGRTHPGRFACLSRTPLRTPSAAPRLGEAVDMPTRPPPSLPHASPSRRQPFAGLKVLDLAWVVVGPLISRALADHGATVIRVESALRPDLLRSVPAFKDGVPGIDRSQTFANFNCSKLGISLNLQTEEGRGVARRLILEWADVVIESFTPGTLEDMCLDYAKVSAQRPDLLMMSTSLRGQTGPERTYRGFGAQGAALAGLHYITGWPDRMPSGPWGPYTDLIAPRYGVAALAAALLERRRTGLGQQIDLSQIEASIHFLEPLLLNFTANGRAAEPAGLSSDRGCPHGTYPTKGTERYVAIAVETPEQWAALCRVAPLDDFHLDAMSSVARRRQHSEAIDAALRRWTVDQDPWELTDRLKRAGVPASVVLYPTDLYRDPQLRHRAFFVPVVHPVLGRVDCDGFVTRFSDVPPRISKAAPTLGQDTEVVLREVLGMTSDEIADLAAAGAFT